jgi:hypothetical protein
LPIKKQAFEIGSCVCRPKAALAILLGWLALKQKPLPLLENRRRWAQVGIALGVILLVTLPALIIFNWHHLAAFIEMLHRMQIGK